MVICMFFGLGGCFSKKDQSPEEAAKRHLEKRYGKKFVILSLSSTNGEDPFLGTCYEGMAFCADLPGYPFSISLSSSQKNLQDAYHCVEILPYLDQWMEKEATNIWEDTDVGVVCNIEALNYELSGEYAKGDIQGFLKVQRVTPRIKLFFPEDMDTTDLAEALYEFSQIALSIGKGTIDVSFTEKHKLSPEKLRMETVEPDFRFYTFDSIRQIQMQLEKGR